MLWGAGIRIKTPVAFVSVVYMSSPENSVVKSLHFSVFHETIIIISGPHLSTFLYFPDINQSKCHVSKCGIYWGDENSWLIPLSSAKLYLQSHLCSNVCINLGPLQWKRVILDLPWKLLLFYWIKFYKNSLHLYFHCKVRDIFPCLSLLSSGPTAVATADIKVEKF